MTTSQLFEKIAMDTSNRATSVDCSVQEYQDGLLQIIELITVDLQASREMDGSEDD
jgi:hypothetical protein